MIVEIGSHTGVESARRALREYIQRLAGDGLEYVQNIPQLLREADRWGPGSPEWRTIPGGRDGLTTYAGRLLRLYAEVRIDGAGRVRDVDLQFD